MLNCERILEQFLCGEAPFSGATKRLNRPGRGLGNGVSMSQSSLARRGLVRLQALLTKPISLELLLEREKSILALDS